MRGPVLAGFGPGDLAVAGYSFWVLAGVPYLPADHSGASVAF